MKKSVKKMKKAAEKNKKPLLIAGIGAGVAAIAAGMGTLVAHKKKSAKEQ